MADSVAHPSEDSCKIIQLYAPLNSEKQGSISVSTNEMLELVEQMERLRVAWKAAEEKAMYYEQSHAKATMELESVSAQLRRCNAELKDARAQVVSQLDEVVALRADNEELLQRFQIVKEVLKSDIEQLPPESRNQLAFLRNPDLGRSNSKRVARRLYMEEEETGEAMEHDFSENALDTMDDDIGHGRRSRSHSVGLRGRRSVSAHAHPSKATKRNSSFICDIASAKAPGNGKEETGDFPVPSKRSRNLNDEVGSMTAITTDSKTKKPSEAQVTTRRSMNRSMPTNDLSGTEPKTPASVTRAPFVPRIRSTLEIRTPMRTPGGGSWTRGMSISSRRHDFQPLSTYFKITSCDVCHGGINFAAKPAYKCRDCLQLAHVSCSPRLILPCVPRTLVFTRTPSRRGQPVYHLQEFCPSLPPMIAYPVIYCIVDLENRGLSREGIYRVPGRKDHVQSVLNELRTSRGIPKLSAQAAYDVADVVKSFLEELRDPLVPKSSREEFIRAAQTNNIMSLNVAICDLPQPNRDTLAYLMLHLQKVATLKELNQMTLQKIARCMAVPIMGQGSYRRGDIKVPSDDAGGKVRSVLQMLKMSSEYWLQFLEYEECHKKSIGGSGTPAGSSAPCEPFSANKSMLGTVTVPHAARSALKHTARREQEFFDSTQ